MKVLMYGWEFPPQISGGLGIACFGIVNELVKQHVSVAFVLPQALKVAIKSNYLSVIDCTGTKYDSHHYFAERFRNWYTSYPVDSLLHPYCSQTSYADILNQSKTRYGSDSTRTQPGTQIKGGYGPDLLSEVFRYAIAAGALAKTVSHDIIHTHDWLTILAGVEAKRLSKKPLIFQVHALETDRSGQHVNQRIFDIEKFGMEQADCIVAVSQFTKNQIIERYGINPQKIVVIHNGIYASPDTLKTPANKEQAKMVLFVGRITYQKGPFYFVEIANKVLAKRQDVQFVIAGTGDLLTEIIEKTASLCIGQNVHFTGFLNPAMINQLYEMADIYVMPSVSEPFGLSCLEALTHHVPVLISKQSGAAEVLNHALKADFWDTDEMAAKILALLEYPALKKEMLKNSNGDLKKLTWGNTAKKLIDLYQTLWQQKDI